MYNVKKILIFLGLISVLSLGLVVSNSCASARMGRTGFKMFDSSNLIGAAVKNSHGDFVGEVTEVMVDSGGNAFAIVNHYDLYYQGGVNTPVPLQDLRISRAKGGQDMAFLKIDMEHLDFAPYLNPISRQNHQDWASSYKYYGIHPYWTQSGTARKDGFMELNTHTLVGTAVETSCGKVIGIVNEVMVDSGGHAFAIVNHGDYDLYGEGGVNTPVPLQDLRISRAKGGQDIAFLKIDMEHLDFAPYLDLLKMQSRRYEASIYEYYGIEPYWTQGSGLSK